MIPIGTDKRLQRTPWANYALVAANALVFFFFQRMGSGDPRLLPYLLHPSEPRLYQFFSSMFMHADLGHILGNMIFLWVFGNAVNDSLGHAGYLAFYLAGGICAGIGYVLLAGAAPVLGASGAISAVTGAFLVLFPRVRVTVLVVLIYMWFPLQISSLVFLLLQLVWNLYASAAHAGGGVAYAAHASGYVFGIVVAAGLLALRVLPRDVYDLLSLLRNWRRRRSYHQIVARGYDPFGGPTRLHREATGGRPMGAPVAAEPPPPPPADGREAELRRGVAEAHRRGDYAAAADAYLELVQVADDPVLPLVQQLDVANTLMSNEQYAAAGDAYERFLARYGRHPHVGDIRLMLGLIYGRYLKQDEKAEAHLSRAVQGLRDANKLELARSELAQVRRRLGR